jgi:hypothetical protein
MRGSVERERLDMDHEEEEVQVARRIGCRGPMVGGPALCGYKPASLPVNYCG